MLDLKRFRNRGPLRQRLGRKQHGQIIAAAPIALLAFIGMVALVVDVGLFKLISSEMQNAADAAALAAVWYDPLCPTNDPRCASDNATVAASVTSPDSAAKKVARDYAGGRFNGQLVKDLCSSPPTVSPQPAVLNTPHVQAITVVIRCQAPLFGGGILGLAPIEVWVAGTAAIGDDDGTRNIKIATPGFPLISRLIPQS